MLWSFHQMVAALLSTASTFTKLQTYNWPLCTQPSLRATMGWFKWPLLILALEYRKRTKASFSNFLDSWKTPKISTPKVLVWDSIFQRKLCSSLVGWSNANLNGNKDANSFSRSPWRQKISRPNRNREF